MEVVAPFIDPALIDQPVLPTPIRSYGSLSREEQKAPRLIAWVITRRMGHAMAENHDENVKLAKTLSYWQVKP